MVDRVVSKQVSMFYRNGCPNCNKISNLRTNGRRLRSRHCAGPRFATFTAFAQIGNPPPELGATEQGRQGGARTKPISSSHCEVYCVVWPRLQKTKSARRVVSASQPILMATRFTSSGKLHEHRDTGDRNAPALGRLGQIRVTWRLI